MSSPRSIDVHAHCVPVGVLETLVAEGGRYGIELAEKDGRYAALIGGRVQTRDILPSLADMPRRLAAMDAAGVDVQLLASWIDLTAYSLDAATAAARDHRARPRRGRDRDDGHAVRVDVDGSRRAHSASSRIVVCSSSSASSR